SALNMTLIDKSTAANLSKQSARMVYIRDASATGPVNAFDTVFTTSAFLNADMPYPFRTANIEGPRVASGKTLQTLYGLFIEAPPALGGSITNAFALVTQPGAGNVGFGTTSPGNPLTVVGTIESTSGGFKFPDGTTQTTAALPTGAITS